MCYVNTMGGTKSPSCNKLVQDIWTWCVLNKVWLSVSHLPGALNVEAGQQSRQFNERTDWHLREDVFQQISKIWGTPDIDLFVSRLNSQLPKYASWKPDPGASHVDALSFAWTGMFANLFRHHYSLVHAFSLSPSSCGLKKHFSRCSQPHILCMCSKVIVE